MPSEKISKGHAFSLLNARYGVSFLEDMVMIFSSRGPSRLRHEFRRRLRFGRTGALVIIAAGMVVSPPCIVPALPDDLPSLAAAIAEAAKNKIVPALEKAGVQSVGVLKFRVLGESQAADAATSRLGAINADLAAQFQTAILLNISRRQPIKILRDPSAVAAAIDGATHLTPEGQEKLFAASYPVVVGGANERVKPDALLFGIGELDDDLRTIRIAVAMIRDKDRSQKKLCEFESLVGAENLTSVGASFVATRGLFSGGAVGSGSQDGGASAIDRPAKLASLAKGVRDGQKPFPLQDPDAPVTLTVSYNDVLQKVEFRDGGAFVAEPRQGQKVSFTIKKPRKDGKRYAIALKVNGENTAKRDVRPDLAAAKWVLDDATPTVTVRGYAIDENTMQPFQVLSAAESATKAFDYGVDAGTITMTVFAEALGDGSPSDLPPDAPPQLTGPAGQPTAIDVGLLSRGVRLDPKTVFNSLDEAKGTLQNKMASLSRGDGGGIIVPSSQTVGSQQQLVAFKPIVDPIMSVVIRYYTRP